MVFGMRWGQYESHSQSNEIIAINIMSETLNFYVRMRGATLFPIAKMF